MLTTMLAGPALAAEGPVPEGVPHLDHIFLIMMENHGYSQIINNPNAPFINAYLKEANVGTNYFAVAHPSLTNYLEVVGTTPPALPTSHPELPRRIIRQARSFARFPERE